MVIPMPPTGAIIRCAARALSASSVIGGMFCMWSDYPGAETQTQEAKKIRLPLRAMGLAMDGAYTSAHGHVRRARRLQRRRLHQHRSSRAERTTTSQTASTGCDLHGGGQRDLYLRRLRRQLHRDRFPPSATITRRQTMTGDTIYTCTRCGEQHSASFCRASMSAVKTGETTEAYTLDGEQSCYPHGRRRHRARRASAPWCRARARRCPTPPAPRPPSPAIRTAATTASASNLIDGDTSTYYWSTGCQTSRHVCPRRPRRAGSLRRRADQRPGAWRLLHECQRPALVRRPHMDDDRHVHEQPQHGRDEDVCRPVLRRELPLYSGRPHDGAQLLVAAFRDRLGQL